MTPMQKMIVKMLLAPLMEYLNSHVKTTVEGQQLELDLVAYIDKQMGS